MLGESSAQKITQRQFYVGNTRYRGKHTIYVSNAAALLWRLSGSDGNSDRDLATEFLERHHMSVTQRHMPRYLQRYGRHAVHIWHAMMASARRGVTEHLERRM